MFVAFANVIQPFVDRAFGFNFDHGAAWDRSFIDAVHERDELEFGSGNLKPTHILALLGKESCPMLFHAPLTPRFCVREPGGPHAEPKMFATPYEWNAWPHRPEDELQRVCQELKETEARRSKEVNELRSDLEERTIWWRGLETDLSERTRWALLLEQELVARTALARDLQTQLEQLEDEIEERAAWGLALDQELQQANQQSNKGPRGPFSSRKSWLNSTSGSRSARRGRWNSIVVLRNAIPKSASSPRNLKT